MRSLPIAALFLCACSFRVEGLAVPEPEPEMGVPLDLSGGAQDDLASVDQAILDLRTADLSLEPDLFAPDLQKLPPTLTVTRDDNPTGANLTMEGTADWAAYGLTLASDVNRKSGVTPAIVASNRGTSYRVPSSALSFSWTDGTPTATAANDSSGVFVQGTGNGFTYVAPADTTLRTLRLYVAIYRGAGTLVAHLSDGSAVDVTDVGSSMFSYYLYTVAFRAGSPAQTLTVTWTITADFTVASLSSYAATLF
jgi:hypothetical protein